MVKLPFIYKPVQEVNGSGGTVTRARSTPLVKSRPYIPDEELIEPKRVEYATPMEIRHHPLGL